MKPDDQYGLLIERVNRYGTERVTVNIVRREPDGEAPLGCSGDGEVYAGYGCPKHLLGLALDGLGLYGFVSDTDASFIGGDVEFRDVYASDERKLTRMLKALKKVNARIEKEQAREPGDKFVAFAKALKLSFAVWCGSASAKPRSGVALHDHRGRSQPLTGQMIEDAVSAEVAARKVA